MKCKRNEVHGEERGRRKYGDARWYDTIFVREKKGEEKLENDDRHGNAKRTSVYSLGTRDSRILGELLLGTTVRVSFCILHLGVGKLYKRFTDVCMRVGNNSFCCSQKEEEKKK